MPDQILDRSTRATLQKPAPKLLVTVDVTGTLIAPNQLDMRVRALAAWFGGLMRPGQIKPAGDLLRQLPIGAVVGRYEFQGPASVPVVTESLFGKLMGNLRFKPNKTVIDALQQLDALDGVEVVAVSNMPHKALGRLLSRAGLGGLQYFTTNNVSHRLLAMSEPDAADAKQLGYKDLVARKFETPPQAVLFVENEEDAVHGLVLGAQEHGATWKALVVSENGPPATHESPITNGTRFVSKEAFPEAIHEAITALNKQLGLGLPSPI